MRPYLAIIRDSFREALVSRVLWILLAIITLVLAALVPLGFVEEAGSVLTNEDVLDRDKLMAKIVAQGSASEPSPGKRIWELLPEGTQRSMANTSGDRAVQRFRFPAFFDKLREMITQRDFYREADWAKTPLPAAAKALKDRGLDKLADDELARFNRLALDAAFPDEIAPIPPKQVQLAYFHWELGVPLPVSPEQLYPAINQLVVAALTMLLGVAGVFIAVMVTASMIPQTFEAGSVDLLLSKPIDRGGLFLAKFVGGCAFIAINAAYFIGGLWLILGVRFGLWNERLLLAIPLYLFLFAIYYGVSALAGIVWRNAIVSVVMAVLFWFVCWLLGTATGLVETLSLNPRRFVTVTTAGDTILAVNSQGETFRWDDASSDWQKVFASRDAQMPFGLGGRLIGPVYDPAGQRILAVRYGMPGFSPMQASSKLLVGNRDDDFRREEGVNVPDGVSGLYLTPQKSVLAVSQQGIYRLEGDLSAKQQDINVFGLHIPLPEKGGRFVNVGPAVQMRPLLSNSFDPVDGALALFDGHRLALFAPDAAGKYAKTHDVEFDRKLPGEVALVKGGVILALEGEVRRYDRALKLVETISVWPQSIPESAATSPEGQYAAVVYRDGRLWLYDAAESKVLTPSIVGQGDVSAVAFDAKTMYAVDQLTRVTRYNLGTFHRARDWQGAWPLAEKIYRYALEPLYTVFPKPSQLNQTVTYALTSGDAQPGGLRFDNNGPSGNLQKLDVWGPIWSNLAFLVAVLALSCVIVYRKDF